MDKIKNKLYAAYTKNKNKKTNKYRLKIQGKNRDILAIAKGKERKDSY